MDGGKEGIDLHEHRPTGAVRVRERTFGEMAVADDASSVWIDGEGQFHPVNPAQPQKKSAQIVQLIRVQTLPRVPLVLDTDRVTVPLSAVVGHLVGVHELLKSADAGITEVRRDVGARVVEPVVRSRFASLLNVNDDATMADA